MRPTNMRIVTAGLLTVMACLLYLDRYAVGIASERMRTDLGMTQTQMSWFLSAFFWSYALSQVPAGWLSDRYGPRIMLTIYILGWSLFTGLLGATTIVSLILLWRFLCGATQAGAYPVASGMVRAWFPLPQRGVASSVVAVGGRAGAVLAPILTAALMTSFNGRWQWVLMLYGLAGIFVAVGFAWVCRNTPQEHPGCNAAERELIAPTSPLELQIEPVPLSSRLLKKESNPFDPPLTAGGPTSERVRPLFQQTASHPPFPFKAVVTSLSLWGNSLTQLLTNVGWLFVVTWLPRYLDKVHGIPLQEQAWMTMIPTAAGVVGMFCGGWWTDVAARRFGLKWGRRIPLVTTRFMAAFGYAACVFLGQWTPDPASRWLPWSIIACLSLATFSCDLGVPAIWAYAQDVGGKFTASIMGWANMWGNLGAAMAPLLYNAVLGETPALSNWNQLFAVCGTAFALSGISALVLDSTKPIAIQEA